MIMIHPKTLLLPLLASLSVCASAYVPRKANFPDIPGYVTLKGDFHVHTAFSDGNVWPTTRVHEALYDDLDIVSMTDHIHNRPLMYVASGDLPETTDQNSAYKLAKETARHSGIILIHGGEVSRGNFHVSGHFNAHFLTDGTVLAACIDSTMRDCKKKKMGSDESNELSLLYSLRMAKAQGAFIVWCHPHWERQSVNRNPWGHIQDVLYKEGLMDGIEIVNYSVSEYVCKEALHWAIERNLAVMSGTDAHSPMEMVVDYESGDRRAMTLVIAKERTENGVREALEAHRTLVCTDHFLYGREELLRQMFDATLEVLSVTAKPEGVSIRVRNNSCIPVELEKAPGGEKYIHKRHFRINPGELYSITVKPAEGKTFTDSQVEINYLVNNFQCDADTPLKVSYKYEIQK